MFSSRETAPAGLGLPPSTGSLGRLRNRALNTLSHNLLLREAQKAANYRPVVHVTQGTVDNTDLGRLLRPTIEALADENVMVVATTGGPAASGLEFPVPANTYVAEHIPHDILLPQVDVMVTNGGYGAVQRALATGVPLVVHGRAQAST